MPGGLGRVQHEGDELGEAVLVGLCGGGEGLSPRGARRHAAAGAHQLEEVPLKDDAQHQQQQHAADTEPGPATTESRPARLAAHIFDVASVPPRAPAHDTSM